MTAPITEGLGMGGGKEYVLITNGKIVFKDGSIVTLAPSQSTDECPCCGEASPCSTGYPPLDVTVSWVGTPVNVNYQAGPPETIDLFTNWEAPGKPLHTWTNGETKELCPQRYQNTEFTGTYAASQNWWYHQVNVINPTVFTFGGDLGFYSKYPTIGGPPYSTLRFVYERIDGVPTTGTGRDYFAFKKYIAGPASSVVNTFTTPFHSPSALTRTGGESSFTAIGAPPHRFSEFGGSMTTTNGVTVTWARVHPSWP